MKQQIGHKASPQVLPSPPLPRLAFQIAAVAITLVCIGVACAALNTRAQGRDSCKEVLRARSLVIEDEQGRERITLGVSGQGLERHSRLAIADADGNKRARLTVFDNGLVALDLDYRDRGAVSLVVVPREGFAGLIVRAEKKSVSERAEVGVLGDGTSLLKLADPSGSTRMLLLVQPLAAAKLAFVNPKGNSSLEVGAISMESFGSRKVRTTPESLLSELARAKE